MNQIAIMESKIEVLGKQVDDLKCCGNCKHYLQNKHCQKNAPETLPIFYCVSWESDGLTRKDRE